MPRTEDMGLDDVQIEGSPTPVAAAVHHEPITPPELLQTAGAVVASEGDDLEDGVLSMITHSSDADSEHRKELSVSQQVLYRNLWQTNLEHRAMRRCYEQRH